MACSFKSIWQFTYKYQLMKGEDSIIYDHGIMRTPQKGQYFDVDTNAALWYWCLVCRDVCWECKVIVCVCVCVCVREREREFVDKQHIDVSFVASDVSSFDSSANWHRAALYQLYCWIQCLLLKQTLQKARNHSPVIILPILYNKVSLSRRLFDAFSTGRTWK